MCGSNPHLSIKITLIGEFSPVGNRKREDMGMDKLLKSEAFYRTLATLFITIFLSIIGFSFRDIAF